MRTFYETRSTIDQSPLERLVKNLKIGTCSWNYHSWVGQVYSKRSPTAVGYLAEYAKKYRTVEIDSWFYKLPDKKEVADYLSQVDADFSFSCKATESITLTHLRNRDTAKKELIVNPTFLSRELFNQYLQSIHPMLPQLDAIMFEFEYLNKNKMSSLDRFLQKFEAFYQNLDPTLPIAIETRNSNYLRKEYFQFLKEKRIIHVFSEKQYMPHVYDVYEKYGDYLSDTVVIRLMGGDRKAIELTTQDTWDKVVEERNDKKRIADIVNDMIWKNMKVIIYVNNHYEGSAPLTVQSMVDLFKGERS